MELALKVILVGYVLYAVLGAPMLGATAGTQRRAHALPPVRTLDDIDPALWIESRGSTQRVAHLVGGSTDDDRGALTASGQHRVDGSLQPRLAPGAVTQQGLGRAEPAA